MRYVYLLLFATNLVLCDGISNNNQYTIDELINSAVNYHPSIKASRQAIKGAEAGVSGAMWNYFPTPKVSAQETQDRIKSLSLSIEQPLWTGGKLGAAYDMASANQDDSEIGLQENAYTLTDSLLNALKTYLMAQGDLEALAEGQKQLNILEGMLSRRIAAGVSAKADMDLLKARLYQMDTDITLAKTKKQISLSQIELYTGKSFDADITIDPKTPPIESDLNIILKDVTATHPSLYRYDAKIDYARAEKKKAKAVIWPDLKLVAQKNYGSTSLYEDLQIDKKKDTAIFLSVEATPGAGFSSISGIQQSEAKIMQLKQEKLSKRQELLEKAMLAYNDYFSALNRVDVQSQSIGSAEKVFASYTRLFLAGKRQWLDLVNASRELTQNEIAFSETKAAMIIASYQIELLSGKIKILNNLVSDKKFLQKNGSEDIKIQKLTKLNNQELSVSPTFDSIMDNNSSLNNK